LGPHAREPVNELATIASRAANQEILFQNITPLDMDTPEEL
jgi:hypothetical protein